jgi:tetratricopeptide (TPR) repeat protein
MDYYDKAADAYLKAKDTMLYHALIQNKIGEYIQMNDYESAIECQIKYGFLQKDQEYQNDARCSYQTGKYLSFIEGFNTCGQRDQ